MEYFLNEKLCSELFILLLNQLTFAGELLSCTYYMNTDKKLWDYFRKGESNALSHIYYQHIQLLYSYGKKFSKDDELIKDTIQDLFYDLIRTRANLGNTDNIKFYLLASFKRKLVKNIKRNTLSIKNTAPEDLGTEIVYSVEKELIEKEEVNHKEQLVRNGLAKLSQKQREILFYRFTCDFDYNQICEIMQLQYDSARKQVFRALKALKEILSDISIVIFFLTSYW